LAAEPAVREVDGAVADAVAGKEGWHESGRAAQLQRCGQAPLALPCGAAAGGIRAAGRVAVQAGLKFWVGQEEQVLGCVDALGGGE